MQFVFYSPNIGPPWHFGCVDINGLGGSETYHVQLALRLARRGHRIISYNKVPTDWPDERTIDRVACRSSADIDFTIPGIWVIQRDPGLIDKFTGPRHNQRFWLVFHDAWYDSATPERVRQFSRFLSLSAPHYEYISQYYNGKVKITLSGSGISRDVMDLLPAVERNPHRLIYSSAPERGLGPLLQSFFRAREVVPDLELHCFYGWEGIDQGIKTNENNQLREYKRYVEALLRRPGVIWHGRVGQSKLWNEYLKSGIWCYQTMFLETFCISCCEAQALGAIPIYNPIGALKDNVFAGVALRGDCWTDRLLQMRYAYEIARLALSPELQEQIRKDMMPKARTRFDWERALRRAPELTHPYFPKLTQVGGSQWQE